MSTETKIQRYNFERGVRAEHGRYISYADHLAAVEEAREAGFAEARESAAKACDRQESRLQEMAARLSQQDAAKLRIVYRAEDYEMMAIVIRALRPADKGEKA